MAQMKALIHTKAGSLENFHVGQAEKPTPAAGQLLVKIRATALNPVDWKMAKFGFAVQKYPVILGCDMAGVVEAVGANVQGFKVGDEVFAYTKLGAPGTGTFTEYCLVPAKQAGRKPKQLSFEAASTFGVGTCTSAFGLFKNWQLPFPGTGAVPKEHLLVWGGSSSVGAFAVQLAAILGFEVIATASERNAAYVKSLGATHVLDYAKPDVIDQIKKLTGGSLRYAFDSIGAETATKCQEALTDAKPAFLTGPAGGPAKVKPNVTFTEIGIGMTFDSEAAFYADVYKHLQPLIDNGKYQPNQVEQLAGGIDGVLAGLKKLEAGQVSGKKLVLTVSN